MPLVGGKSINEYMLTEHAQTRLRMCAAYSAHALVANLIYRLSSNNPGYDMTEWMRTLKWAFAIGLCDFVVLPCKVH